ncbi:MAG: oxygen-independent coproporphyrinogen III oxidase, partial [Mariprofundaceae bacterium]|nr:oxygen-independent coproporphyrinogen III oxidase [Mariprofundaceae bacterium]
AFLRHLFILVTPLREYCFTFGIEVVEALLKEIDLLADTVGNKREVSQLHCGGGTPTFLSEEQIRAIMGRLKERFSFAADDAGEFGIEIDPRECDAYTVTMLRKVGFNRMSMGVQDFDPTVQKAVNRIQSQEETLDVLRQARADGFQSINIDLMYGLPNQSVESFDRTLSTIIDFSPDRIALFNYAHLPRMFMPQRRINEADLPTPGEKLNILKLSIDRLLAAGYVFIGMDHFAKPDDELTIAQREGKLYRNFQGYSTHADAEMLGIGITSIGYVDGAFYQNIKTLDEYYQSVDAGEFPVFRGYQLSDEDHLRRHIIMRLMCDFALDFKAVEQLFGLDFQEHFGIEIAELADLAKDGLLELGEHGLTVLPGGRLLIRNIAMVFDEYLRKRTDEVKFSKVI